MTQRDADVHGWVCNDAVGLCNVDVEQQNARGTRGSARGAHLGAHITEEKREIST